MVTDSDFPLAGRIFDAVLFDFDGTLADSTPAVNRSWLQWAEEFGIPPESLLGNHGLPSASIVQIQIDRGHLAAERKDEAVARIDQLEIEDHDGVIPLPGAIAALASLPDGRAAIVTSCSGPLVATRLRVSGITPPGVLVSADQLTRGKPDPEGYLTAAAKLGADPTRCLVIEDAPGGLAAGRAAGATTLAVTTTSSPDELDADAIIGTLVDVRFSVDADGVRVHRVGAGANAT